MNYVLYVFAIAIITMILFVYGQAKEKFLPNELTKKLFIKCRDIIIKYLSKNKVALFNDLEKEISNVTTGVFWSKRKVKVVNPKNMVESIIDNLIKHNKVEVKWINGKKIVELK